MLLPLLVVALIALGLLLRARGGRRTPDRLERIYLVAAPLPLVLVLLMPAVIGLAIGFDGHSRPWIQRVNMVGLGLSLALLAAGIGLIARARSRREAWGWPLAGAVLVACTPLLIVALTYALFALAAYVLR